MSRAPSISKPPNFIGPGPRNDLSDIAGLKVGQVHDEAARTGVTVVLPDTSCVAAVDVRGGGPGTRETDLLEASRLVREVDAVVLAGGSVYGLEAASGVANWLGARGRGYRLAQRAGVPPSPIVPAAILYDLANGGDKDWGEAPPYAALGAKACDAAQGEIALGNVGAGYGARAGVLKGGLGAASIRSEDGVMVAALVAVNSFGSPLMPGTGAFWAWPYEIEGEFGGMRPPADWPGTGGAFPPDTKLAAASRQAGEPAPGAATTIGVVATNAALDNAAAKRLAVMAQGGVARAVRPAHAPVDGDVIFALATGEKPAFDAGPVGLTALGEAAAECVARAIARGVYEAEDQGDAKSWRALYG